MGISENHIFRSYALRERNPTLSIQVRVLTLIVSLFIPCAQGFAVQDPNYLICKQLYNQWLETDITYDEWTQLQPNPLLIGYRWKVRVEVEWIDPGWFADRMTADGELEITDKLHPYGSCCPHLMGKYNAKVDWKIGPNHPCDGQIWSGTLTDVGDIDGVACKEELSISFIGISKRVKYTERCPWGNVDHERDFNQVSTPHHNIPYKDGEYTDSHPSIHLISKLKVQAECPVDLTAPSPLVVNITAAMPSVTNNHSLTGAQIRNLVSKPASLAENAGLTRVHVSPKLKSKTSGSNAKFGSRNCMWVDTIDVDISYPAVTMYIATEYPVGSCNYNVTLTHENEHVKVAKDLLAKHAARIRTELEKTTIPNKNMTMVVNDFISGQSQIDTLLKQIVDPLIQDFEKEIEIEFSKLDSPANYENVRSQCPSW